MILPSACPVCPNEDCVTLREVARIAVRRWWHWWLDKDKRVVRRVVTGYMQQCPLCETTFIVTLAGVRRTGISRSTNTTTETDDTSPQRAKRPPMPAWKPPPTA